MRAAGRTWVLLAVLLLAALACAQDEGDEYGDGGYEEEGYEGEEGAEDGEGGKRSKAEDKLYLEPHYFMRTHMYVPTSLALGYPVFPTRQNTLEQRYSIVKLDRGYLLPKDLTNQRIRLDLGHLKDGAHHSDDLTVQLSDTVVPMTDHDGKKWKCHVPVGRATVRLNDTEVNELVRKADVLLAEDVGRSCWVSNAETWGMEFCWNRSLTTYDISGGVIGRRTRMGTMSNRTHHYELASDGFFIDPLAMSTLYTSGDACPTPDPFTGKARNWTTSLWLHCTQHSSDHEMRDRWGSNPEAVPWSYQKDNASCVFRVDMWSKAVCTATLPLLHLNQNYVICV